MARPSKNDINSGIQNWDSAMDDNDEALMNAPLPIHEHTGDESDLQSTFAAASYDRCSVMVDHTTLGWSRYVSNGTAWVRMEAVEQRPAIADATDAASAITQVNAVISALQDHGLIT
jgi:hypothetical protein